MSIVMGEKGRVVVPAPLRKALGIDVGTELVVRIEGNRLVLETRPSALRRLKARFAAIPANVDLAQEIIDERRREVAREEERSE